MIAENIELEFGTDATPGQVFTIRADKKAWLTNAACGETVCGIVLKPVQAGEVCIFDNQWNSLDGKLAVKGSIITAETQYEKIKEELETKPIKFREFL